MPEQPQDSLLFMLGEMRADLKHLVRERSVHSDRLDAMEASHSAVEKSHAARITKLEHFRTKIGVYIAALGIGVPTVVTIVARKLGLL